MALRFTQPGSKNENRPWLRDIVSPSQGHTPCHTHFARKNHVVISIPGATNDGSGVAPPSNRAAVVG